jgi:hypothetical protein
MCVEPVIRVIYSQRSTYKLIQCALLIRVYQQLMEKLCPDTLNFAVVRTHQNVG